MNYTKSIVILLIIIIEEITLSKCGWKCGWTLDQTNMDRIMGGWETGYLKYPWYAALNTNSVYNCGGSLIAPNYVLTAAHCFPSDLNEQHREDYYNVTLGIYNRCKREMTQRYFTVEKVYIHEDYEANKPYYDIALMVLKGNTKRFMPICVPTKEMIKSAIGKDGYITGLGYLKSGAPKLPCVVHEAKVKIHNDTVCKSMLERAGGNPDEFVHAFCAGYLRGGIDTCQGDSGGPLMVKDDNGAYTVMGVTSFGYGCGAKDTLGVYTETAQYLDWIQEKMNVNLHDGSPYEY